MTEKLKAKLDKIEKLKAKLQSHIHRQIKTDERCEKLRKQIYTLERALESKPQKGFYIWESKGKKRYPTCRTTRLIKITNHISVLDLTHYPDGNYDIALNSHPLEAFKTYFPHTRPHTKSISMKHAEKKTQEILTLIKNHLFLNEGIIGENETTLRR